MGEPNQQCPLCDACPTTLSKSIYQPFPRAPACSVPRGRGVRGAARGLERELKASGRHMKTHNNSSLGREAPWTARPGDGGPCCPGHEAGLSGGILLYAPVLDRHLEAMAAPTDRAFCFYDMQGQAYSQGRGISEERASQTISALMRWPGRHRQRPRAPRPAGTHRTCRILS